MSILEQIHTAALKFLVASTPNEVYQRIVTEAIKLVDVEDGAIYLKNQKDFKAVYATRPYVYKIIPRKSGNTHNAFTTQKTIVANVTRSHPELKKTNINSSIFIPLSYGDRAIGVLTLDSKRKEDFTESKRSTLALFGSLASLAIRKAQLYNEAQQAIDTRDLFISLAAHELRTPLTTVDGYIQLLKEKVKNKKPIQMKWIENLSLESNRLKLLIDEFLEINRIKTGKLQYEWKEISVRRIVKKAISIFKFNKPERKITFYDLLAGKKDYIIGDRNKLMQVLINVLENADKYSPSNKEIIVNLKLKKSEYVVEILDQGMGIEEEDLSKIFKGFYKGKNSLHEGMGLGLYLAKLIIIDHHGTIDLFSKLGKGTKVEIRLPRVELV